jgi:hypothetical protein
MHAETRCAVQKSEQRAEEGRNILRPYNGRPDEDDERE